MEVTLTPDQEEFIQHALRSGRFHRQEEAIQEALALWEERERKRAQFLATLDEARESVARGEGILITPQNMRALAEDVKRRGSSKLAAQHDSR